MFTKVGQVIKRVTPKPPRLYEKVCRCGHPKNSHQAYPASVEMQQSSGTICLLCDCPLYKFGSRRVKR